MESKSLIGEAWREYDYQGRVYRIDQPVALYIGTTTHRVVSDDGIVHCVPAPGVQGCVLRWKPKESAAPVQF